MSTQTLRSALARHRGVAMRWFGSAALFTAAGFAVAETAHRATPIHLRPAVLAVTAPVAASSGGHALALAAARSEPASPTAAPPAGAWELANLANPRVDTWVHRFTTTLKDEIGAALHRGTSYDAMISSKLAARDMPQELKYLALIESEYKPRARSRVAAVGLWQFMAGTARRFGLAVGRHGDQRTNPARETDAALAYLSQLHDRFGSWYLAAAAYNAGPGSVDRAMRRVLGHTRGTDADFYKISRALPAETREYVPKLIAAARIGKDPAKYDFKS